MMRSQHCHGKCHAPVTGLWQASCAAFWGVEATATYWRRACWANWRCHGLVPGAVEVAA